MCGIQYFIVNFFLFANLLTMINYVICNVCLITQNYFSISVDNHAWIFIILIKSLLITIYDSTNWFSPWMFCWIANGCFRFCLCIRSFFKKFNPDIIYKKMQSILENRSIVKSRWLNGFSVNQFYTNRYLITYRFLWFLPRWCSLRASELIKYRLENHKIGVTI